MAGSEFAAASLEAGPASSGGFELFVLRSGSYRPPGDSTAAWSGPIAPTPKNSTSPIPGNFDTPPCAPPNDSGNRSTTTCDRIKRWAIYGTPAEFLSASCAARSTVSHVLTQYSFLTTLQGFCLNCAPPECGESCDMLHCALLLGTACPLHKIHFTRGLARPSVSERNCWLR